MLLAFVRGRELSWQPARWLLVAILLACLVNLSLPGFLPDRPRGMTLMYSEVEGSETGYVVLESLFTSHDEDYASGHGFKPVELDSGWLQRSLNARPGPCSALNLPGVEVKTHSVRHEGGWMVSHVLFCAPTKNWNFWPFGHREGKRARESLGGRSTGTGYFN